MGVARGELRPLVRRLGDDRDAPAFDERLAAPEVDVPLVLAADRGLESRQDTQVGADGLLGEDFLIGRNLLRDDEEARAARLHQPQKADVRPFQLEDHGLRVRIGDGVDAVLEVGRQQRAGRHGALHRDLPIVDVHHPAVDRGDWMELHVRTHREGELGGVGADLELLRQAAVDLAAFGRGRVDARPAIPDQQGFVGDAGDRQRGEARALGRVQGAGDVVRGGANVGAGLARLLGVVRKLPVVEDGVRVHLAGAAATSVYRPRHNQRPQGRPRRSRLLRRH